MRFLLGFLFVCAVASVPLLGCSDSAGVCSGTVCACTEEGILAAIAAGGGPYTFACDGPQTVVTQAGIAIDNDVILDGEGDLTVEGKPLLPSTPRVFSFSVPKGVKAELRRLTATGASGGITNEGTLAIQDCVISGHQIEFLFGGGAGISNAGEMTIINSTVSENYAGHGVGGGISNDRGATLALVNSTVSGNGADGDGAGLYGGGVFNAGEMIIINSTVSGNTAYDAVSGEGLGGGIANTGWMSLSNSTVWGNSADSGDAIAIEPRFFPDAYTEIANTLIEGDCARSGDGSTLTWVSNGYNIESPGDTCGIDQATDRPSVTEMQLNLGPLQNNGGPTETHEPGGGDLGTGSFAIDQIPASDCVDADGAPLTEDQRGQPRPAGVESKCDVGAFEVQP